MIQYNKINHKVIKPHDFHIRISFFVHKNCIIKSNLCLMANKFSPKYHDLKIYEFIWWNISYLHSFTLCLLISLQETCVYAWHILASKPLHNGLSADNTKSSDFWYFKEILSFLHSGSFRHFFTICAFTFQYKTILDNTPEFLPLKSYLDCNSL